jgi:hypothetical protein
MAFEKFGREDQLRALGGCFAHEFAYSGNILLNIVAEGELQGSDCYFTHFGTC